ncbi:TPA: hypothetical protein ACNMQV_005443 [Klebsiella pneumoniae]|uniref:hypothetical protein n=1 Tax=Enterobacteriaceae TaxID=543 RepID=UPI0005F022E3|nr:MULTISPECIES: hypothetical protein [Enterobacteriaceae]EEH8383114.1 hypothetical protein [Salmonella enterica subsp. enterica serovar Montevideo]EEK7814134.1 hypothetical protein [Salmonella enterica subsp. enterica serovar Montevideo]EIW0270174.1 hypothetical protein [Klebsiella pneumoniae]EIW0319866.1 hypothetical protein [Klebsiella pneumoniae]EKV7254860.1 hypothetical protein [Escherichia coli]
MKILSIIFCVAPVACFASNKNVDHVFINAFQAAIATSLCTDVATATNDSHFSKDFKTLIQLCKEQGDQRRAILDAYTNAEHI